MQGQPAPCGTNLRPGLRWGGMGWDAVVVVVGVVVVVVVVVKLQTVRSCTDRGLS